MSSTLLRLLGGASNEWGDVFSGFDGILGGLSSGKGRGAAIRQAVESLVRKNDFHHFVHLRGARHASVDVVGRMTLPKLEATSAMDFCWSGARRISGHQVERATQRR